MRIDLHTHSNASDGTMSPAELMVAAAAAGLDVVAITDHDTTAGWQAAVDALPAGLTLVRGAEISCKWLEADPPIGIHLLAYLFDPEHPELAAELRHIRAGRVDRAKRMVELMAADGIDVTWAEIESYAAGAPVGRPHLAQALIRRGLVATVSEAFEPQWLGERFRFHKRDTEVFAAVQLARAAGGVVVFAHPKANRRGRTVPDRLIAQLADAGVFGLEADHPDHDAGERAHIHKLATELGMVATGSSDFHGTNKTVKLAQHTTTPAVYERIVAAATGCAPIMG